MSNYIHPDLALMRERRELAFQSRKRPEGQAREFEDVKIKDETADLLQRVVDASNKKEGITSDDQKILDAADKKISKEDYSNLFKSFANSYHDQSLTQGQLMARWEKELEFLAKDLGVIDKYSDQTLKQMLNDWTPQENKTRKTFLGALQQGLYNQVEGFEYAGRALGAAIKGDKHLYTDAAGMAEDSNWTDIMRDLVWMGNTESETGGKMFFADLLLLPTSPLKVPFRMLAGQTSKAVLKQAGQATVKNVTKKMTLESVEAAIKAGAKIEVSGIGARWIEKDISKMAIEMTKKELAESGVTKISKLPTDLIQKNTAKILYEGLEGGAKTRIATRNLVLGGLDAINIPLSTKPRELFKLMMGYGTPVMANAGDGMAKAAEIFGRPGDVAAKFYAKYYLTEYEKQLAAEFQDITGANPLSDDFELTEEWNDYKNSKIKNEGFANILLGKKESSSGKFWNAALETMVNMSGMMFNTKVLHATGGAVNTKLQLTSAADLTRQITELRNEKYSKLDSSNIKEFVKEIESLDFKKGGFEDYKLINRADELIAGIVRESNVLSKNDPVVAGMRQELISIIGDSNTPKADIGNRLNEIKAVANKLSAHLDADAKGSNLTPNFAELKKIAEYFQGVEDANTFSSRLKASLLRNLARGSSQETRNALGGISTAEALMSGNSLLSRYAFERVVSYEEMARSIAEKKRIEVNQTRLMNELIVASKDGLKLSGFLTKITEAVNEIIERNIRTAPEIVKEAILAEGITKVYSAYLVLDDAVIRSNPDFKAFTHNVLSDTFGVKIASTLDPKTIAAKFANEQDAVKNIRKAIEKMATDSESIFNGGTDAGRKFLDRYKTLNKETRQKVKEIAKTMERASSDFYAKTFEAKIIEEQIDIIKNLGIQMPTLTDRGFLLDGKIHTTQDGSMNALKRKIAKNALELQKEALKDPSYTEKILTPKEIEDIVNKNFEGLVTDEAKRVGILDNNIAHIEDMYLSAYGLKSPDVYRSEQATFKAVSEAEALKDQEGSAESDTNKFVDNISNEAKKVAYLNPLRVSIGNISKISKTLNLIRTRDFSIKEGEKVKANKKIVEAETKKIKEKQGKAGSVAESLQNEYNILTGIISDIQRELDSKSVNGAELNVLKKRMEILVKSKASLAMNFGMDESGKLSEAVNFKDLDAEGKAYLDNIEKEIANTKKVISDLEELKASEVSTLQAIQRTGEKIKGVEKTIEKHQKNIEIYRKEAEKLNSQVETLLSEIDSNPFSKQVLSDMAREANNPGAFFDKLNKEWIKVYGDAMPLKLREVDQYPIYSALKQSSDKHADGSSRQFIVVDASFNPSSKNPYGFDFDLRTSESPIMTNGTKIQTSRIKSPMERMADEKGYKIVELAFMENGGKAKGIGDIAAKWLDDETAMSKQPEKLIEPKTFQEKIGLETATMIAKKTMIGPITNGTELAISMANIGTKFEVGKNKYVAMAGSKFFTESGRASQGAIDTGVIVNPRFINFIYNNYVLPLSLQAASRGYTLLGSINEEGKRLFFTRTIDNADNTIKKFYSEVLMIPETRMNTKDFGGRDMKRFKVMGANDIYPDLGGLKNLYAEAGIDRGDDFKFKGIRISDEDYNKMTLKIGDTSKDFVSTDGQMLASRHSFESVSRLVGNNPMEVDMKGSMSLYDQGSVVKAKITKVNGNVLNQEYIKKQLPSELKNQDGSVNIKAFEAAIDFIMPDSTFKILGEPTAKVGDIFDISPESLAIKKIDMTPKKEVTLAPQIFNIMPRTMFGDTEKMPALYDAMIKELQAPTKERIKEFTSIVNAIMINPAKVLDILDNSPLSKGIAMSEDMSKAITDLSREGALKSSNIGMIKSHLRRILSDKVLKWKVRGTESVLMGIGTKEYNSILSHIKKNQAQFKGVTDRNFLVLDRSAHIEGNFYKDASGRAEAISYRYPVNRPGNVAVNKIVWLDELPDNLRPELGHGSLLNMFDVAMLKDGDFDIDKINVVYDKALGENTRNYLKYIAEHKDLQIGINVKNGEVIEAKNIVSNILNNSKEIAKEDVFEVNGLLREEQKYLRDINKTISKHNNFDLDAFVDHILGQNKRVNQVVEGRKIVNPLSGPTFMESLLMAGEWNEFQKIKLSGTAQNSAANFANAEILKGQQKPTNNATYDLFTSINKAFANEVAPIYSKEAAYKLESKVIESDIPNIKVEKDGNIVGINGVDFNANKYVNVPFLKKLIINIEKEIDSEISAASGKELKTTLRNKKSKARGILTERLELAETIVSKFNADKSAIIKKYQDKVIREVGPKLNTDPEKELVQRAIMSDTFGSIKGVNGYRGKAMDLIPREIHSEYNRYYNQKYVESNMANNLGVKIDPEGASKIKGLSNDLENKLKDIEDEATRMKLVSEYEASAREIVREAILKSSPSEKPIKIEDLEKLGSFGGIFKEVIFDKDWAKGYLDTVYSVADIKNIKSNVDKILTQGKHVEMMSNKKTLLNQSQDLNQKVFRAIKERNKLEDALRNETEEIKKAGIQKKIMDGNKIIANDKKKLIDNLSFAIAVSIAESKSLAKTTSTIADSSLKLETLNEGVLKDKQRAAKQAESNLNEIRNTRNELIEIEHNQAMIIGAVSEIQKLNRESKIRLSQIGSEDGKARYLDELKDRYTEIMQKASVKLLSDTTKDIARQEKSSFLRSFDARAEMAKESDATNKAVSELYALEGSDFLSNFFSATTKIYKNLSVGIAAGRAVIESANAFLIWAPEKVRSMKNAQAYKAFIEGKYGDNPNFKYPEAGKFTGSINDDFFNKSLEGLRPEERNKVLKGLTEKTSKIAGVASSFVNILPSKMAQDYYTAKFNELVYIEASKKGSGGLDKSFLIKDPKTLNSYDRQQYYKTIEFLQSQAKKQTQKAFFNYEINPLIAHKMEKVMPFSNFLFSGLRLFKNHPRTILGMNAVFSAIVNNYGEDVQYIENDENGDPVRRDYGRRLKIPLLASYAGASFNPYRLLQFSPTDSFTRLTPFLSIIGGEYDWRTKSYMEGDMSGLEYALGTVSPSISQLATGIVEKDYQKRFSAISYLTTGFATKSAAHSKIANDFYINQDYGAVLNAPEDVKRHLYDAYNKKNKDKILDDNSVKAMKAAVELGLLETGGTPARMGVYETQNATRQAIILKAQLLHLAQNGNADPLISEDQYKEEAKYMFEFVKWAVGDGYASNMSDPEWMKKVDEFVKAGHLDNLEKVNPAYAKAMRHFAVDNRDYYENLNKYREVAYGDGYSKYEKDKANAALLALKYEVVTPNRSLDGKIKDLMEGDVQFIVDKETGQPLLTKERMAEIDYRGHYVASYENAISEHVLYRDMYNFYVGRAMRAKESKDKNEETSAWQEANRYKVLANNSYRKLKEEHETDAKIFDLKRIKEGKTPGEIASQGYYTTQKINSYITKRNVSLNEFYNQIANDRIGFLEKNDVKWSEMSNREKGIFMSLNNGKTVNQVRQSLQVEGSMWEGLIDINGARNNSEKLNNLIQKFYE